jgi:hypothetical protein
MIKEKEFKKSYLFKFLASKKDKKILAIEKIKILKNFINLVIIFIKLLMLICN